VYEVGQSKKEALKMINEKSKRTEEDSNPNSPELSNFGIDKDVSSLQSHKNIQCWCGRLLFNCRKIHGELNNIFGEIIKMTDGFFSSQKKLEEKFENLYKIKKDLRNLQIDMEEFGLVISITDHKLESTLPSTIFQALTQVNNTYKNTYDMLIYKLTNISNTRVTRSTIIISILALIVSIISIIKK
jgi:hypothetical protein